MIDDVLRPEAFATAVREFPGIKDDFWKGYLHVNETKYANTQPDTWGETLTAVAKEFVSPEFLAFLEELTGISDLLPVPSANLLWAGAMVALTGALHMAGGALWNDRTGYILGIWISVVNVVGIVLGAGWHALIVAVLGGGGPDTAPLNFDDDEIYSGRGKRARTGGTTHAAGGDSGRLGPPAEQLSGTNTPSDPDAKKADLDDAA